MELTPPGVALVAVFGLVVGSFLNVCIWRAPRGRSLISPPSACPYCGTPIRPYDNIPVLSYLMLLGRCRVCQGPISARYPLVEALNSVLYVLCYQAHGLGWHLPVYMAFLSALVVISFIDLDHQIIPDGMTVPGMAVGLALGAWVLEDPFVRGERLGPLGAALGLIAGYGAFYLIKRVGRVAFRKDAMGGGDVKLMGMVGAVLGWKGVFLSTFFGSLTGSLVGLAIMAVRGRARVGHIPFGPFLALGAVVSLLYGDTIYRLYTTVGYAGR